MGVHGGVWHQGWVCRGGEHGPWGDGHAAEVHISQAVPHCDRPGLHGRGGESTAVWRTQPFIYLGQGKYPLLLLAMQTGPSWWQILSTVFRASPATQCREPCTPSQASPCLLRPW